MLNSKSLSVVIPARYRSSRLPGKILSEIHGHPMIYWTYQRACAAEIGDVIVAADDPKVYKVLEKYRIPFVETSEFCKNGTERIAEAAGYLTGSNFFINIQADEPLLNPQTVIDVFKSGLHEGCFKTAVSCADSGDNTSEVKVAISNGDRICYASRSAIPFSRDKDSIFFKIHGVYLYSRKTLEKFVSLDAGPLERLESVEQLRCIEHDIPLYAVKTTHTERSVDTNQDLIYMQMKPKSDFYKY